MSLRELKHWELAPFNPQILSDNNIQIALTMHGQKPLDFFKDLKTAISCGFSKQNALKSLTYNPAKFLKIYNEVGSISKGKRANFLIFSGELFANDFLIYENWINGKKHLINNKNIIKLLGNYALFLNEEEKGVIQFKIENNKIVGSFLGDSLEKKPIKNIEIIGDRISFSQKSNLYSGVFDSDIFGEMQDSLNNWKSWKLVKNNINIKTGNKEKTKPKKHGAILFPNMAYGFQNLPKQQSILFQNATVWTNESRGVIENCDVAIERGKIIAVGKKLKKSVFKNSKDIEIIDATGKHITSGIIDEHSHIAISRGVNEGTQAITAEVRIGDVINANDINIYRQLAGGVTVAQLLHGSANPIGGQSAIIKLRWGQSAENLKFSKAKPFIKFALGENVKQSNWGSQYRTRFPQTRMGVEQIMYDAFSQAKEYDYNSRNYKKNKTLKPRKDLELDALVEILNKKRFITCHSYIQSEINMLINLAEEFGFIVNTFTHILEGYKIADKLKNHGSNASTFSDWWAYKYEVIDAIPFNGTLMADVGVNVSFNSDSDELARRMNLEAAKAVKYGGISEEKALEFVTINPAIQLGIDNKVGSLEIGKDADFTVWSGHPLSNYSICEQTWIEGKQYFSIEQDKFFRARDQKLRNDIIQKILTSEETGTRIMKPDSEEANHFHSCKTEEDHTHELGGVH